MDNTGDKVPMGMVKTIACGLLLLPVAEIFVFFIAVGLFGFARTVILVLLISLAGLLVVRRVFACRGGFKSGPHADETGRSFGYSRGGTARTDQVVFAGLDPATLTGGVLLLVPGLITGLLGVLVLHRQSRQWLLRMVDRRGPARPRDPGPRVVELSPSEWKRLPERMPPPWRARSMPWRRGAAAQSDPGKG